MVKRLFSTEVLTLRMAGDASSYGIGAEIAHIFPDGSERPVASATRTLTDSEKNYSQVEKKAPFSNIWGETFPHVFVRSSVHSSDR